MDDECLQAERVSSRLIKERIYSSRPSSWRSHGTAKISQRRIRVFLFLVSFKEPSPRKKMYNKFNFHTYIYLIPRKLNCFCILSSSTISFRICFFQLQEYMYEETFSAFVLNFQRAEMCYYYLFFCVKGFSSPSSRV